ncbi:hypothetical protein [Stutzerimonas kunmingensis]|uniref:hypothetical protein n=1 Tax=Stutzerimonas kunmingensis TaxID=1211807 RepID=UPI00241E43F4|nr:hypothetical protein [Stutzerimonas kunmingensis]
MKLSTEAAERNRCINNRQTQWKWYYLYKSRQFPNSNEEIRTGEIDKAIKAYHLNITSDERRMLRKMQQEMDCHIIDHTELTWMINEKRQNAWIINQLIKFIPNIPKPKTTSAFQSILYQIDTWSIPKEAKIDEINKLKHKWLKQISRDKVFKWFEGKDEKTKIEATHDIVIKQLSYFPSEYIPLETIDDVILFFDRIDANTHEHDLLIRKIKARWSQNNYRKKTLGKKQYNFVLSKQAIESLDRLSEKHSKKRTEILELIIRLEQQDGLYSNQISANRPNNANDLNEHLETQDAASPYPQE